MKHYKISAALVCVLVLASSCATTPLKKDKMPPLNGMIYDRDNNPVSDTEITMDGIFTASSDVYGHFSLTGLKRYDTRRIVVSKKGFEDSSVEITYTDPTQILYISMYSAPQLIAEAENAIQAQDWQSSESFLLRAEKSGGDKTTVGYLKAVLAFKKQQYPEAATILLSLLGEGKTQPYICLFLADIYEYHLKDTMGAREYLGKFLESRYDPDVESRLKILNAVK